MSRLQGLFRQVSAEQDALRASDPATERLAARFRRFTPRPRRSGRGWLALAASFAIGGLIAAVVIGQHEALAVKVGGGTPPLGAWLGAPDRHPLPLEFSDGSRFELSAKSRARLVELERNGARVELASGTLHVRVVPRGSTKFRIDAGQFGVHVTGTRFDLRYSPEDDVLELSLEEGQVELTGCVFGNGRKLTAGQVVRASCRTHELDVSYRGARPSRAPAAAAPAPAAVSTSLAEPAAPAPAPPVVGAQPTTAGGPAASASPWLSLARAGRYAEAHAAVEHAGFEAECLRASPEALAMLADVLRHAGAPRQAEHALLVLRRRFSGTADAALAAFALGRLQFDEYRAYPAAASWFRTYLKERPGGPMTREALGRLIEASSRSGDSLGARATAERYLRDYPSGPHAELASRVVAAR